MKFVELSATNKVATVLLNRQDIHNAFDEVMIAELIDVFDKVSKVTSGSARNVATTATPEWSSARASVTRPLIEPGCGFSVSVRAVVSSPASICRSETVSGTKPSCVASMA